MVYKTASESFPQLDIGELMLSEQEGVSRKYFGYYSEKDIAEIARVLKGARKFPFSNLAGIVRLFNPHEGIGGKVLYLETIKTETSLRTSLKTSGLVIAIE